MQSIIEEASKYNEAFLDALNNLRLNYEKSTEELKSRDRMIEEKEKLLEEREREINDKYEQQMQELSRVNELYSKLTQIQRDLQNRVHLDIGGRKFTTTIETLTREKNTLFCAMFGEHASNNVNIEEDGTIFIDRDGRHFDIILKHLRGGDIREDVNKLSEQEKNELQQEIKYYMLHSLYDQSL